MPAKDNRDERLSSTRGWHPVVGESQRSIFVLLTDVLCTHPVGLEGSMSLLFFLPFLTAAADDAANAFVHQMEKRIMAAWHLPKKICGIDGRAQNEFRTVRAHFRYPSRAIVR